MKTKRLKKGKRRGEGKGKSYASTVSGIKETNPLLDSLSSSLPPAVPLPVPLPPAVPLPQTVPLPPAVPLSNMGQTYSYNPLASYAFIPKYFGIEETPEGIEKTKTTFGNPDNNLCRHMINFFPAFSIDPAKKHNLSEEDSKKFRTIVCSLLYMFGTFTKYWIHSIWYYWLF